MPLWWKYKQRLDIDHVLIINGHGLWGFVIATANLNALGSGVRNCFDLVLLAVKLDLIVNHSL
jgi:hypothetical protein